MRHLSSEIKHDTHQVIDITGPENTLILLPAPGDEVTACGGLIAQSSAQGRPPFVVILGDGAADGSSNLARERERASRIACWRLGLPDNRLLFVGLRQSDFPPMGTPVFKALQAAMAQVSWRHDCNVILAPFATPDSGDAADATTAWRLACTLAGDIGVPLLAGLTTTTLPLMRAETTWQLDARQRYQQKAEAGLAHGYRISNASHEVYGRVA